MDASFELYRIFYHVARCGNITQAAGELMSNQPNVTRAMKNLEAALDCALFVRNNRGVTLTPEGEKLYGHVAVAMQSLKTGEQEIIKDRSLQGGTVHIASSEIALRCCLLPVLERFRREYPGVRIKLTNHSTPQAIEALKMGLADFAVVSAPYRMPEQLSSCELLRVREVPVCGGAYAQLCSREVSLKELTDLPLVCMNPGTTTYHLLQDYYGAHGAELAPDIEVATADQLLPLIQSNLGIGFVPEGFLEGASGVCKIKLKEPVPEQVVCLLKRSDAPLSIAAKALEKLLIQKENKLD